MKRTLTIRDLMASYGEEYDLRLTVLAGENGLDRTIDVPDVNRPGLSLTGFFEYLPLTASRYSAGVKPPICTS
jgi:HPr kinase/phosphorylase